MSADRWGTCPICGAVGLFREDYEFSIQGGKFTAEYGARCTECGFSYTFNSTADIVQPAVANETLLKERDELKAAIQKMREVLG